MFTILSTWGEGEERACDPGLDNLMFPHDCLLNDTKIMALIIEFKSLIQYSHGHSAI